MDWYDDSPMERNQEMPHECEHGARATCIYGCMGSIFPVPEISRDETINAEVIYTSEQKQKDLEEALARIARWYDAGDILAALAKAYQNQRDSELESWYEFPDNSKDSYVANRFVQSDLVSQKLLKVIRELEGKH